MSPVTVRGRRRGAGRPRRKTRILLVEDNAGDVRLTREALVDAGVVAELAVVDDGDKALAYLRRVEPYGDAPRPDLVLLDLNLPKRNGREVLAEVKADPNLRRIPVIVLTTSGATRDIEACYDLHANSYVLKPLDLDDFARLVAALKGFWLEVARLP